MRQKMRRILAGLLGAALLAGCGAGSGQDKLAGPGGNMPGNSVGDTGQEQNITSLIKGRYAEYEIPYAENSGMQIPAGIFAEEGGLYLLDIQYRDARVRLEGSSFLDGAENSAKIVNVKYDALPKPLYERRRAEDYIEEMEMAGNGARMYTCFVGDGENSDQFFFDKYFLSADGVETPWDGDGAVSRDNSASYFCGDDGYFYVLVSEDGEERKLYRVDSRSGETKYLTDFSDLNEKVQDVSVFRGKLFAVTLKGVHIFDAETMEELAEDKVLNDLLGDAVGKNNGNYGKGYLLAPGPDDSVYVATEKGLYRHVLYGSVSELLVDGTLTSLGDISKLFVDLYVDEEGENGMPVFYLLYDVGKLMRFSYAPELPTAPVKTMVLYSLTESDDIRLVIGAYQALHPDVYVRYEIGMSGKDGVTRQDALNSLATRIAAGEGPDIFLLDDLPYESYREKGVLKDLSGIYGELQGEARYFDNIIRRFYQGDQLCAIPMMFAVPVLVGDKNALAGITDAESMVRAVENSPAAGDTLRIGFGEPDKVLQCMSYTNCGEWLREDGSLDRDALARFLMLCKRMYEADCADISSETLEKRMGNRYDFGKAYQSGWLYRESWNLRSRGLDLVTYGHVFAAGLISGDINAEFNYDYAVFQKVGADYKIMPGDGKVALPFAMLGINTATPLQTEAEDFVKYALGDYQREGKGFSGIPINRDALVAMERDKPEYSDELSYGIGFTDENGEDAYVSIEAPWREMAVYEEYNALLDSLDSINLCPFELLSAVLENGSPALTGEKTVEETVDEIAKKVQLYLAE